MFLNYFYNNIMFDLNSIGVEHSGKHTSLTQERIVGSNPPSTSNGKMLILIQCIHFF